MKRTRREALAAMAGGLVAPAFTKGKPNFSGRWIIDLTRTTFRVPADFTEVIEHRDPVLKIETSVDTHQAIGVSMASLLAPKLELTTTGEGNSNPMPIDLTLTAQSHWEGRRLVSKWRLEGLPTGSLEGTWARYLDADGKSMTVDLVTSGGAKAVEAKFVFTRKG